MKARRPTRTSHVARWMFELIPTLFSATKRCTLSSRLQCITPLRSLSRRHVGLRYVSICISAWLDDRCRQDNMRCEWLNIDWVLVLDRLPGVMSAGSVGSSRRLYQSFAGLAVNDPLGRSERSVKLWECLKPDKVHHADAAAYK